MRYLLRLLCVAPCPALLAHVAFTRAQSPPAGRESAEINGISTFDS